MKIHCINIYNLNIPFARTIRHNLYSRTKTQSIIVVVQDQFGNKGVGEGTPRQYVTGEKFDQSLIAAKVLSQQMCGRRIGSSYELFALLHELGDADIAIKNPAALCAVETALLDIWARVEQKTLYHLFINRHKMKSLTYSGVIPSIRSEKEFSTYIELVKKLKLTALKIKVIDIESSIAQLKTIRKMLGGDIQIRVDANCAFSVDAAMAFIKAAHRVHLSAIEQPVAKDDLNGLKKVSENSDIPIIADESMYTPKGPHYLIENDLCHGLNIRLSSCGGFQKAYTIYQRARLKHMIVVLGAHVGETAILSFAGRNLAVICPEAAYLEGSFSKYVLKEDLANENISFGLRGIAPVPTDAGLGIGIETAAIERWSQLFASIRRGCPTVAQPNDF